jgi:hypothetical protein
MISTTADLQKLILTGLEAVKSHSFLWGRLSPDEQAVINAQEQYWTQNQAALADLLALVQRQAP